MKILLILIVVLSFPSTVYSGLYQDSGYPPQYAPAGGGGQFSEDLTVPESDSGVSRPEGTEMIGSIDDSTSEEENQEEPETTTKRMRTTTRKHSSESSSSSSEQEKENDKSSKKHKTSSSEKESSHHHLGSDIVKFGDSASTSAEFHKLRKRIKPLFAGTIDSRGNLFTGEEKERDFKKKFEDESASTEYERVHGKEHGDSDELEDEGHGGHKVHWGSSKSGSDEEESHHKKSKKHRRHSSEEKTKESGGSEGTITSLGEFGDNVDAQKADAVSLIKEVLNP